VIPVQEKAEPPVGTPGQLKDGEKFPFEQVDHGEIPAENMDVEFFPPGKDFMQKGAELVRLGVPGPVPPQPDPAGDIPPEDQDGMLCPLDDRGNGGKVSFSVDQEREPVGVRASPAIPPFLGDQGGGRKVRSSESGVRSEGPGGMPGPG
jgi:hypothetical protein